MKRIILAVGGIAVIAGLAACGGKHASVSSSPSAARSDISAFATSTAAQQVKADFEHCWPAGTIAQGQEVLTLKGDTAKHPNGSRARLARCMGVSKADEKPFISDVLTAAESALLAGQLNTKAERHQFVTGTLLPIAAKYDGHTAVTPAPSCSHVSNQGGNQGSACASVTK